MKNLTIQLVTNPQTSRNNTGLETLTSRTWRKG